ncbi:hypothetical protein C9374_000505 [Naegleria lovaniensis]|uniref:Phosphatidate cytidylyltransferase n=1 Tax=Naegleria lovaniensis TaxID=51637 RepID=A0AA88GYI0_NAELO|nr:uncharacterized protein C9374_000505 [Naegleria lovaniensis]KAG2388341.1 hypothetical protein C9374_000505 [Naegleria lovaniensis]
MSMSKLSSPLFDHIVRWIYSSRSVDQHPLSTNHITNVKISSMDDWMNSTFGADRRNIAAFSITLLGSVLSLGLLEQVGKWTPEKLRRKLVHIGMGPIYVLFWNLFAGEDLASRFWCASIPGIFTFYFILVGLGLAKNEQLVKTLSRSGDCREILKGPTFYGLAIVASTLAFWRRDVASIVTIMILCGGDGFADVIGRSFGHSTRFSNSKSLMGSIGMFCGGFAFSSLYLYYFEKSGNYGSEFSTLSHLPHLAFINLACTVVESLTYDRSRSSATNHGSTHKAQSSPLWSYIFGEDNIVVSLTASLLSKLIL